MERFLDSLKSALKNEDDHFLALLVEDVKKSIQNESITANDQLIKLLHDAQQLLQFKRDAQQQLESSTKLAHQLLYHAEGIPEPCQDSIQHAQDKLASSIQFSLTLHSLEKSRHGAGQLAKELESLLHLYQLLMQAIATQSIEQLETAIAKCEETSFVSLQVYAMQALTVLNRRRREEVLRMQLNKHMSVLDREALEAKGFLDECEQYGTSLQKEIEQAKQLLAKQHQALDHAQEHIIGNTQLQALQQFKQEMQQTLPNKDLSMIDVQWKKQRKVEFVQAIHDAIKQEQVAKLNELEQDYQDKLQLEIFTNTDVDIIELLVHARAFALRYTNSKTMLQDAMNSKSKSLLIEAIPAAQRYQTLHDMVLQATSMLQSLDSSDVLNKLVQQAIQERDMVKLKFAIEQAKQCATSFGLDSELIAAAEKLLGHLELVDKYGKMLQQAMHSRDIELLQQAIKLSNGIQDLQQQTREATELLAKRQTEEYLRTKLRTAIDALDRQVLLSDLIMVCEQQHAPYLDSLVQEAKQLLQKQQEGFTLVATLIGNKNRTSIVSFLKDFAAVLPQSDLQQFEQAWKQARRAIMLQEVATAHKEENEIALQQLVDEYQLGMADASFAAQDAELAQQITSASLFIDEKKRAIQTANNALLNRNMELAEYAQVMLLPMPLTCKALHTKIVQLIQELQREQVLCRALEDAIAQKHLAMLQQAVNDAVSSGIASSVLVKLIDKAVVMLQDLQQQLDLETRFRTAIANESVTDVHHLQHLYKQGLEQGKYVNDTALANACADALQWVADMEQAKQDMQLAMQTHRTVSAIQTALPACERFKTLQHLQVQAQALIAQLLREQQVVQLLVEAMQSRQIVALQDALAPVQTMADTSHIAQFIQDAQSMLVRLKNNLTLIQEFENSITSENDAQIAHLCKQMDEQVANGELIQDDALQQVAHRARLLQQDKHKALEMIQNAMNERAKNAILEALIAVGQFKTLAQERKRAMALLDMLKREEYLIAQLQSAMELQQVPALQQALVEARTVDFSHFANQVDAAQELLNRLLMIGTLRTRLVQAMEACDRIVLQQSDLLQECAKLGDALATEILQAKQLIEKQQAAFREADLLIQNAATELSDMELFLASKADILNKQDANQLMDMWKAAKQVSFREALENHIASENDEQIKQAIKYYRDMQDKHIFKQDEQIPQTASVVKRAQQAWLDRTATRELLHKAIQTRDKKLLTMGIAEGKKHTSLSALREKADAELQKLLQYEDMVAMLQDACKSTDLQQIQQAVVLAEESGIAGLEEYIALARSAMSKKLHMENVRKRLQDMIQRRDRKELQISGVMDEAEQCGMQLAQDLKRAREMLALQEKALVESESLYDAKTKDRLDAFLQQYKTILPDYDLQRIEQEWKIKRKMETIKSVNKFVAEEEEDKLNKSIATYEKRLQVGIFASDDKELNECMGKARDTVKRLQNCSTALLNAIRTGKRDMLEHAISQSSPFKCLSKLRDEAQRMIELDKLKQDTIQMIEHATKSNDLKIMEDALAWAQERNVQGILDLLGELMQAIERKKMEQKLRNKLQQAMASGSVTLLRDSGILERCVQFGDGLQQDVEEARKLLQQMEQAAKDEQELFTNAESTMEHVKQFEQTYKHVLSAEHMQHVWQQWEQLLQARKQAFLQQLDQQLNQSTTTGNNNSNAQWERVTYESVASPREQVQSFLQDLPATTTTISNEMDQVRRVLDLEAQELKQIRKKTTSIPIVAPLPTTEEQVKSTLTSNTSNNNTGSISPTDSPQDSPRDRKQQQQSTLPSKTKGKQTYTLNDQLDVYLSHIMKKGAKGLYKTDETGRKFVVDASDKYVIFIARLFAALLAERTKSMGNREYSPFDIFGKIPKLQSDVDAFSKLHMAQALKTEKDYFSLSLFLVFYLMVKGRLHIAVTILMEQPKLLDQVYESIAVLRNVVLFEDFLFLLRKLTKLTFVFDFDPVQKQQDIIDELVADSIHGIVTHNVYVTFCFF